MRLFNELFLHDGFIFLAFMLRTAVSFYDFLLNNHFKLIHKSVFGIKLNINTNGMQELL